MEVYAAMVDRMDRNVGRVLDALRSSGELDNTVIVFLADNGAEGLDIHTTGLQMLKPRLASADNSVANLGAASSYSAYGAGWAQAATAPSWLIKGYATEGGTRAVSFISWKGLAKPRSIGRAYANVADLAPTLLDIAGVHYAGSTFAGRAVQPLTGRSLVPWLTGKAEAVHSADEAIGTELFGSRSIRRGNWKITDPGDGTWRLFDLSVDPGETQDLAVQEPERLKALTAAWAEYAAANSVILPRDAP